MYEPGWLQWWRRLDSEEKQDYLKIYFPNWKGNPTFAMIKKIDFYLDVQFNLILN